MKYTKDTKIENLIFVPFVYFVGRFLRSRRILNPSDKWQVPVSSGRIEAVSNDKLVRYNKPRVVYRDMCFNAGLGLV